MWCPITIQVLQAGYFFYENFHTQMKEIFGVVQYPIIKTGFGLWTLGDDSSAATGIKFKAKARAFLASS